MMNVAALQFAVHAKLKADAALIALIGGRVFDQVPDDVGFPYISYGPTTGTPNEADCFEGEDIAFQIDIWSRQSSRAEAARIGAAVKMALHRKDLTITDGDVVLVRATFSQIIEDPDGRTFHGMLRFEAMTEVTI